MPLYHYWCPDDHETERYRSLSARDEPCECARCGKPAIRALRASPAAEAEAREEPDRLVLHGFRCVEHGHRFEDVLLLSELDSVACPKCGSPAQVVLGANTDLFSQNLYPYFDRGLGCVVRSKAHRAELCRQMGVVPVDGDYDVRRDAGLAADEREAAEDIGAYDAYMDEIEHAPHFAEYRRLRGAGAYGDIERQVREGTFHPFRG